MSSPQLLPNLKDGSDSPAWQASANTIPQQLRSELRFFGIVVLLVIVGSFVLQLGDLLELVLTHQEFGIDEIIVIIVLLSILLTIFLIRRWRDLRQAVATRAQAMGELKATAHVNGELSKMTGLLHACFTLEEAN